jgi:hypothetical protein
MGGRTAFDIFNRPGDIGVGIQEAFPTFGSPGSWDIAAIVCKAS